MGRQEEQELRRLEAALMENGDPAEDGKKNTPKRMYNSDQSYVDLDTYSDAVLEEKHRGGFVTTLLTMLAMVGLSCCILIFLKLLGVL